MGIYVLSAIMLAMEKPPLKDLTDRRFGKLRVLQYSHADRNGHAMWKCQCSCGEKTVVRSRNLRSGNTSSCGCRRFSEGSGKRQAYVSWLCMRQRCGNPNHKGWRYYGARGIKVAERWSRFENFFTDMGPRPRFTTLDRFPNRNGNYEPGNCRWATMKQQHENKNPKK